MLASELSAARAGLVLICRDSSGKGQRGGEAGEAARRVLGPVPNVEQHGREDREPGLGER